MVETGTAIQQLFHIVFHQQVFQILGFEESLAAHVGKEFEQGIVEARHIQQADRLVMEAELSQVNASNSSSIVPIPPGRAMKASARSAILCFRSCIE